MTYFNKEVITGTEDLEILLQKIQQGDKKARDTLIRRFRPFILKVVSQSSGRYIHPGEDDVFSIGLIAFNEALDSFDSDKMHSFIPFAETVIKRRLIDYYRREDRLNRRLLFTDFESGDGKEEKFNNWRYVEYQQAEEVFRRERDKESRVEEILRYRRQLAEFNITLDELVKVSPKHKDARLRAMEIARVITEDPRLLKILFDKKELPLRFLEKKIPVSRKTMERQRKYIIAVTLILTGNYLFLRDYVKHGNEGGKK